jgi:hypothetical protein
MDRSRRGVSVAYQCRMDSPLAAIIGKFEVIGALIGKTCIATVRMDKNSFANIDVPCPLLRIALVFECATRNGHLVPLRGCGVNFSGVYLGDEEGWAERRKQQISITVLQYL